MRFSLDDNSLNAFLRVTYHAGQVKFVPGITGNEKSKIIRIYPYDLLPDILKANCCTLPLHDINLRQISTDDDRFRQYLLGFLQDPGRSGKYAIGPHTYTKATYYFMQEISIWYPESVDLDEEESSISGNIKFHDNIWTLDTSGALFDVKTFLFLGYIIFFLPQCSKFKQLLEHCKQQSFLTQNLTQLYPKRTALVRQAMQDYLERVESEVPLECGEGWDD